VEGRSRRKI